MIDYIEKGYGLHKIIGESGLSLEQLDGVWVSSDDIAVQAIIDAYDPLPEAKTEAKERIRDQSNSVASKDNDKYPAFERQTWVDQETEARDWIVDNTFPTPMMDEIALRRGVK